MDRKIIVKGVGTISLKPDLIRLNITIESSNLEYDKTMESATKVVTALQNAATASGFKKEDLKTTNFNVKLKYENYQNEKGQYLNKFAGYICHQVLKLEFEFDKDKLSKILNAVATSSIAPQLDLQFTIKDQLSVSDKVLINATENAIQKAKTLAVAANVELGELISIDYGWVDRDLLSPTRFEMQRKSMVMATSYSPDIQPEDLKISEQAIFTWTIK